MIQEPYRFVSWIAVSSAQQAKGVSLAEQEILNKQHIAKWGGVLVEELLVQESRSIILLEDACRTIEAYRRLKELLDTKNSFDVLILYDTTRLARDHALAVVIARLCEQAGVRIYETTNPPGSLDTPLGSLDIRLNMAVKSVMSHDEIDRFKRRSRMGRIARVKKGKHSNIPPYGFRRYYDENGSPHTEIDPHEAEAVRLFYDLYLNHNWSVEAIGQELTRHGYISRRGKTEWKASTTRLFLRNRWTYAGYTGFAQNSTKYHEEAFWAKAEWEPIITEDTARRAEVEMNRRQRAPRAANSNHRFSMMCVCDICGQRLRVHNATRRHKKDGRRLERPVGYQCPIPLRCKGGWVSENTLKVALRAAILDLRDEAHFESLMIETPDKHNKLQEELSSVTNRLAKVQEERKLLIRSYTRGVLIESEYESMMLDLEQQMEALAQRSAALQLEISNIDTADDRRTALAEIRDRGEYYLDHPDRRVSNSWLRPRFTIYIRDNRVVFIAVLPVKT